MKFYIEEKITRQTLGTVRANTENAAHLAVAREQAEAIHCRKSRHGFRLLEIPNQPAHADEALVSWF